MFLDVDEAGVAFHQGYGEFQDALEDFVERILAGGGDFAAEIVEQVYFGVVSRCCGDRVHIGS